MPGCWLITAAGVGDCVHGTYGPMHIRFPAVQRMAPMQSKCSTAAGRQRPTRRLAEYASTPAAVIRSILLWGVRSSLLLPVSIPKAMPRHLLATAAPGCSGCFAAVTVAGVVEGPPDVVWQMLAELIKCGVFSDVKVRGQTLGIRGHRGHLHLPLRCIGSVASGISLTGDPKPHLPPMPLLPRAANTFLSLPLPPAHAVGPRGAPLAPPPARPPPSVTTGAGAGSQGECAEGTAGSCHEGAAGLQPHLQAGAAAAQLAGV